MVKVLQVWSLTSALYFSFGNVVVLSPQRIHGSRWIANDRQADDEKAVICEEPYKLFLSLFQLIFSSFANVRMIKDQSKNMFEKHIYIYMH